MKKILLATTLLVAFLTACTGKSTENKAAQKPQINQETAPIHLTKSEFISKVANFETSPTDWKYLGDKPCIVDFYATWCGPCKMVAPILDELAAEYNGKVYIYKVDVDAEPEIAAAYGIQSIPTLFFCPVGGVPKVSQGAMQKEDIKKMIEDILQKK